MEHFEEILDKVEHLLEYGQDSDLANFLEDLNISDIRDLIDEIPEHAPRFVELLSIGRAIHVFRILDFPVQERIFKKLSVSRITELINELPPDDRTAFFSELHGDVVKKLIILLPAEDRKEELSLL